jgi:hypothetical protein
MVIFRLERGFGCYQIPTKGRITFQFCATFRTLSKGQQIRQQLEVALQTKDFGRVAYLEAESSRLPPVERQLAAVDVLAIARAKLASVAGKG